MRRELERAEEAQVAAALAADWSWARIGRALGVSRQAVHRKYSRCPPVPLPWTGPVFTNTVRVALLIARTEAAARGDALAGTEDVLLGLMQQGEGRAPAALRAAGVELSRLRAAALVVAAGGVCDIPPSRMGLTSRARSALEIAARDAAGEEDERICDHHLLGALLQQEESGALRLLEVAGVTPEAVTAALEGRPAALAA